MPESGYSNASQAVHFPDRGLDLDPNAAYDSAGHTSFAYDTDYRVEGNGVGIDGNNDDAADQDNDDNSDIPLEAKKLAREL